MNVYGALEGGQRQGKTKLLGEKPFPRVTSSEVNPTLTGLGSNPGLGGDRPASFNFCNRHTELSRYVSPFHRPQRPLGRVEV